MTRSPTRAKPVIDDLSRPFWDAAREGSLAIQRCGDCGYFNHPPKNECDLCLSHDLAFEAVAGTGTIWSFTVMHQQSIAGFEESTPYMTALVELDEQPMLLLVTNLPGAAPEMVEIGTRVSIEFEAVDDDVTLPQFRVLDVGSGP